MSILEILEVHLFVPGGFVDPGNHCSCGNYYNNEYVAGKIQLDEHLAHVAQVLEQHEREAKADAWNEGWEDGKESVHNFQGKFDNNPYKESE